MDISTAIDEVLEVCIQM